MKTEKGKLILLFKKYWFRVSLICLGLFLLMKKDLSFQVNLRSPYPVQELEEQPSEEVITVREGTGAGEKSSATQKLGLSPVWEGKKGSAPAQLLALEEVPPAEIQGFLDRFRKVALSEQDKYGIPAALTLAHALLLSRSGQSYFAREGHNHFALPCTSDWKGPRGDYDGTCLRHYPNAWTSFRDHSLYLTTGRYARMKQYGNQSYAVWVREIAQLGFDLLPDYSNQVDAVVKKYGLERL